jgi:hypothetical protein
MPIDRTLFDDPGPVITHLYDYLDAHSSGGVSGLTPNKIPYAPTATTLADSALSRYGSIAGYSFNVKDYGAVSNGVANDAAAIQAAIDAAYGVGGGNVLFPSGTYKVAGTGSIITVKKNVSLLGVEGKITSGTPAWTGSVIDAQTVTAPNSVVLDVPLADNVKIRGLSLRGPISSAVNDGDYLGNGGVAGIKFYASARGVLEDVFMEGFSVGAVLQYCTQMLLNGCYVDVARNIALSIWGTTSSIVFNGHYGNSGFSNRSSDGNIRIGGDTGSNTRSKYIKIWLPEIDEAAYCSLGINGADSVTVDVQHIWATRANSNGTGPGYGIKLGDGTENPTNVTIIGTLLEPFSTQPSTDLIHMQGSGHTLLGVKTNPLNGSGDIVDTSTGTVGFVNGAVYP